MNGAMIITMKVSELVKNIVDIAESTFDTEDQNDDCINVGMYYSDDKWFVWLYRSSAREQQRGLVSSNNWHTVRLDEIEIRFYTKGTTITKALEELQNKVYNADGWNDVDS